MTVADILIKNSYRMSAILTIEKKNDIKIKTISDDNCRHFYQKLLQNERNSYNELKYQVFDQVVVSGY